MTLQWIKRSCITLGLVALLAALAACSSVQANGQSTPVSGHSTPVSGQSTPVGTQPYPTPTHQGTLQPTFSPNVLVVPASGTCHTGGIQVRPGATFAAETNGQTVPVQLDSTTHTATFPTLPDKSFVVIHVPAHTDLNVKDCNNLIDVSGITGQMDLSANTITATQVHLLGSSHLHVGNGSITFDGSLDSNSTDTFDAHNGFISIKLPKSDPAHIDATTTAGTISTNVGTPAHSGSSGSQLHVSTQPAPGALVTVKEDAGSINFTFV